MVGLPLVAAVFLSNLPESIAATTSMRIARHRVGYVFASWMLVVAATSASSGLGYVVLGTASPAS